VAALRSLLKFPLAGRGERKFQHLDDIDGRMVEVILGKEFAMHTRFAFVLISTLALAVLTSVSANAVTNRKSPNPDASRQMSMSAFN
jgi:hypothetical protein